MKGTTKHCYILNIQVLGLVVSEKKIFHFIHIISLWQIMMPPDRGQSGPRGMVGRIYKGNTKHRHTHKSPGPDDFREKELFMLFLLQVYRS